jgi:hypothetical protein
VKFFEKFFSITSKKNTPDSLSIERKKNIATYANAAFFTIKYSMIFEFHAYIPYFHQDVEKEKNHLYLMLVD